MRVVAVRVADFFSVVLGPPMSKVLGEHHVLQTIEVGLSHKHAHVLVDEVDIVLGLDDSVHIDVHGDVEAIVDVLPHEGKDELEQFGGDVELHFADVHPFVSGLQLHRLDLGKDQLVLDQTQPVGFQIELVKELDDNLEDARQPGQDFLLATDVLASRLQLGEQHI